jgi:hypothetical protein
MTALQKVNKELFKELEEMGLIDYTKGNSNCYTTCRKKKYVCDNVLKKYEYLKRKDRRNKK